uniref:Kh domain-rna-signal transduction-associated protein 2-like protein n=1 Tax=Triatoma infestans TaxID=30076 RepID=A0A170ZSB1_TRIIF
MSCWIKVNFQKFPKLFMKKIDTLKYRRQKFKAANIMQSSKYRIIEKVLMPQSAKYKNSIIISKLLGTKGRNLKQLERDTKTKMSIRGRGSMADKKKEDELAATLDPKFEHLAHDLHIEIFAEASAEQGHIRVANAIQCLRQNFLNIMDELDFKKSAPPMRDNFSMRQPTTQMQYTPSQESYMTNNVLPPLAQQYGQFPGITPLVTTQFFDDGNTTAMMRSDRNLGPVFNRSNVRQSPYDRQQMKNELLLRN